MSDATSTPAQAAPEQLEQALFEIKKVIVGQDRAIERLLVCLLARGHCLLEGVPGLAKTLAVETLATVVGGTFTRLQFTPDLLPADIVGTRIYRASNETLRHRAGVRSSPTSCSPTRSTVRRPRCSRRCSRSWPSTRCRSAASRRPRARALPRARHAEPDRVRGRLPAARGATRPLPDEDRGRLPDAGRRARDRPPHGREPSAGQPGPHARGPRSRLQAAADAVYVDHGVVDYAVNLVLATREPAAHGLPELDGADHLRCQPPCQPRPRRRRSGPRPAARSHLRAAPGRLRRRPRRAASPAGAQSTRRWPRVSASSTCWPECSAPCRHRAWSRHRRHHPPAGNLAPTQPHAPCTAPPGRPAPRLRPPLRRRRRPPSPFRSPSDVGPHPLSPTPRTVTWPHGRSRCP